MADSTYKVKMSRHPILWKKLCGYGSSSTSSEWHPPSMALFYYIVTALEPLLKRSNRSYISALNIFCTAIIWSGRSWIKMMSSFRGSIERRIWLIHLLKPSISKNLKFINRRWVYNTIPIGFSPSGSCWKLYLKVNHQPVDDWDNYYNYI